MKKFRFILLFMLCISIFNFVDLHKFNAFAEVLPTEDVYVVYDESGDYLFERINVAVGDEYIDKELNSYEVVFIDEDTKTGRAKYVKSYKISKLKEKKETNVQTANSGISRGMIGLYMTHNDESYISGDGYDSVYGKGGIHDVSKMLATCLRAKSVDVVLDETLHIPHDTSAYSRSGVTARRLLNNYNLDGLFDIHRDGASRGFYVTTVNGEERCMVRMVIGKGNSNYEENKGFALYLMSVSQIYCPWLFVDIYMGNGHYNQALKDNMVLFEFGSHLVEKDLVLKTVPDFAEVLSAGLFGEFVEDDTNSNDNQNTNTNDNPPIDANQSNISNENQNENYNQNSNQSQNNNANNNQNLNNNINNDNVNSNGNQINVNENNTHNDTLNNNQINNDINNDANGNINNKTQDSQNNYNYDLRNNENNSQNSNNISDNNTTIISGEKSALIVYFVIGLLIGYVLIVSFVKRKHK